MEVKKSDGSIEEFSKKKLGNVIRKVYKSAGMECTPEDVEKIIGGLYVYDGILCSSIRKQLEERFDDIDPKLTKAYKEVKNKKVEIEHFVEAKKQFIENYKKASNTANATVDDNSNVSNRNVAILSAEAHKTDNIQVSRSMIMDKLKELFPDFKAKNYIKDLESHVIYKNDESSFAGAIAPYCVSITMYPFLTGGIKNLGGLSAQPKNIDSYCGMLCNLMFAVSSQFAGACMYKDQELIIKENGSVIKIKSKDLIEKYFKITEIKTFENYQGEWEYVLTEDKDLYVQEDGCFVKINKLYRRKYSDKIYRVKTGDGYSATVTKDHKFKQLYCSRFFNSTAEELEVNDTVVMNKDYSSMLNVESKDWKTGWLIGMICGDGNITLEDTLRLSVNYEQEFLGETFNEYLKEITGIELHKRDGHRCFTYEKRNKDLMNFIKSYIIGDTTYTKHIDDLDNKTFEFKLGFLDGLFCSDGSFSESRGIRVALTNKDLIQNIIDILDSLNIPRSSLSTISPKGKRKESYAVYAGCSVIKYLNHIKKKILKRSDSTDPEGPAKLPKRAEKYYYGFNAFRHSGKTTENYKNSWGNSKQPVKYNTDIIESIETFDNDDQYVYEIETETHWYNCGGFITHNCAVPEALVFFDYFSKKEWGNDYYKHPDSFCKVGSKLRELLNKSHYWTDNIVELQEHDFGNSELNRLRDEIVEEASARLSKEELDDFIKHVKDDPSYSVKLGDGSCTILGQIKQYWQQIVFTLNQPSGSRGYQSVFSNFSYFDLPFFEGMFGNFYFPDGTQPEWESIKWLQQQFMMWFNEERLKTILTFPVESVTLLYKDGKFQDEEMFKFVCEEYARGHSFFTYISDSVDSLSSCCFKGDTKVSYKVNGVDYIKHGTLKDIYDLEREMKIQVPSLNPFTGEFCYRDAKVIIAETSKWVKFELDNGDIIESTPDHVFPIDTTMPVLDEMCEISDLRIINKMAIKILPGEYLLLDSGKSIKIKNVTITDLIDNEQCYCFEVLDEANPYFVLDNGVVTHNCRLKNKLQTKEFNFTNGNIGVE